MLLSASLACSLLTPGCSHRNIQPFEETSRAVSRLLSLPGYTVRDEQILNMSGDSAAAAVMKSVTFQEMASPEKRRQILLILHLAFEAPQLIVERSDRTPTAAMLLLDKLERTELGQRTAITQLPMHALKSNTMRAQGGLWRPYLFPGSPSSIGNTHSGLAVCSLGQLTSSQE